MTSNCVTHQEIARVLHADGSEYKIYLGAIQTSGSYFN